MQPDLVGCFTATFQKNEKLRSTT